MNRIFLSAAAVLIAAASFSPIYAQPKTVDDRQIVGNYYDTATIEPSVARIKSLKLPAGFQIAKFAEVANPRMLAVAPDGTVYVSQRMPGTIAMLKDTNGDGVADVQKVVAEKKQMHGLAIHRGKMYLMTVKELFVADIKPDGTLSELRMLLDDLPDAGQHPNRTLAVGPDNKLYISVGSTCNACDESSVESATMLVADLDGSGRKIFAAGLRNTIGFGWHPSTKKFYGMDHGIDMLGDNDQGEELNELVSGAKYGWAYVYADSKLNPHNKVPKDLGLTNEDWAKQSREPLLMYTAHAAPMQMMFYTGAMFPAEYKNDAFVAFRGSWNRNPPSGYEVVRVRFDRSGKPTAFEPFLSGFLIKGGSDDKKDAHFARLAGIAQLPDGSMLVSDDTNNIIYRVTHGAKAEPPIMMREGIAMNLAETAGGTVKITVKSSSFSNMGAIKDKHSAYFDDISPQLSWSGAPAGTKSIVLMMEDPDSLLKPTVHWLAANISPDMRSLSENIAKTEAMGTAMQGTNINGKPGYFGPRPPAGDKPHAYHFQVFALDTMLDLPSGFNRQALLDAMKGHVIGKGEIVGMYQRRPGVREKK